MEFKSTMESEIHEQPNVLNQLANTFIDGNTITIPTDKNIKKVKLVASGSSYHCALMGVYLFNKYTDLDATCYYSGEYMLEEKCNASDDTLYVFISQSGETFDTMECLNHVKETKAKTICITNCENSRLYKMCDYKILSTAGEELSIASTKALSAQIFCLILLALSYCKDSNLVKSELEALKTLPSAIDKLFEQKPAITEIAKTLSKSKSVVLIGNQEGYALSKEGALKIKETSYVNTGAYPMGEFLHGHVAVLNNADIPVIVGLTQDNYKAQLRVVKKVREDYNPYMIALGTNSSMPEIKELSTVSIDITEQESVVRMFLILITYQLLALNIATLLNRNIDSPKGLSKVVS